MSRLIIGCGYLGRRVASLWQSAGHRVFATTRRREHAETLRADGLEPVVCDVLDAESLKSLPAVDTVAYVIGFDRGSGATMRSVYVDGLANVLKRLPTPRRFIHVSSSSVYGQTDGGWVDEESPTEPEEESGKIVLDAERLLREMLPSAIVLRFAGIYGAGRLLRRATIEKGEAIVGDADRWLNLIHVDDGASAMLAAESHAAPGRTYNICDDQPVRRRDFYIELARVLGAPPPCFVTPAPDQPAPPHEKANRRIRNGRMKEELHVELRYAGYVAGLAASVMT
jgi:nucleoside-diphosphate-sugar epimerase